MCDLTSVFVKLALMYFLQTSKKQTTNSRNVNIPIPLGEMYFFKLYRYSQRILLAENCQNTIFRFHLGLFSRTDVQLHLFAFPSPPHVHETLMEELMNHTVLMASSNNKIQVNGLFSQSRETCWVCKLSLITDSVK